MVHDKTAAVRATFEALKILALFYIAAYFLWFEPPFLSYPSLPFEVLTPQVVAGQPVRLTVDRCNSDGATRVYGVSHRLVPVDGQNKAVVLPATLVPIEPGCTHEVSAVNVVPPGTPPGRYIVDGFAEVQATLRSISVHWSSQPFEVIP